MSRGRYPASGSEREGEGIDAELSRTGDVSPYNNRWPNLREVEFSHIKLERNANGDQLPELPDRNRNSFR